MRQRCDDSVRACTASPPRAACRCSGRARPATAPRKGGGVQRSPSTPQLEDFMSKALFSLVVFVAVLAIAPFAHSATASEVRPTSLHHHTCTQQHFRLVIHNCFLFSPLGTLSPSVLLLFSTFSQVQSQFLRLADQLDSSIHRFHSSQSAVDLDGIDDSINELERRSKTPAVTSLTLRSYLAQREQILYAPSLPPSHF
jgi:hypothetical protein